MAKYYKEVYFREIFRFASEIKKWDKKKLIYLAKSKVQKLSVYNISPSNEKCGTFFVFFIIFFFYLFIYFFRLKYNPWNQHVRKFWNWEF